MKQTFNLRDTAFSQDACSVRGKVSRYIQWDRSCTTNAPTFYTHEQMFREDIGDEVAAYGWLIESKALIPQIYREVPRHLFKFAKVFTHDKELLDAYPDVCKFSPGGGVWLGGSVGKGSIALHPKTKSISLVSSNKLMCPLHHFRHRLAHRLYRSGLVDVYGDSFGGWVPIADTVCGYRYSVVIENDREPLRFTEKILNCFAAGTIPIYVGGSQIGSFFNPRGIICTEPENILNAIRSATPEFYEENKDAVKENYQRCLQYETIEDFIWSNYFV